MAAARRVGSRLPESGSGLLEALRGARCRIQAAATRLVVLPPFLSGLRRGTNDAALGGPCTLDAVAAPAPDVVARIEKADETTRVIAVRSKALKPGAMLSSLSRVSA